MENVKEMGVKEKITDWFFKIKGSKKENFGTYKFGQKFSHECLPHRELPILPRSSGPWDPTPF